MQLPLFEQTSPVPSGRIRPRSVPDKPTSPIPYDAARNDWQTPQQLVSAAIATLGLIDLDPCANAKIGPVIPATTYYAAEDNSLARHWEGRVFLIPPYGRAIAAWVQKLVTEYETGDVTAAIALVPGRTDTLWWHRLAAYPYCAIQGRVNFVRYDGKKARPTFGSAMVYLGPQLARFAGACGDLGTIYIPYHR
ncbi:MAG: DNA N-6-adenine-methyltransferase [Chloroflexota bacterium]